MRKGKVAILYAILAAGCYGISAPLSKLLLERLSPTLMAALLYLGAGAGMLAVSAVKNQGRQAGQEARITRRELPYVVGMILLDIAAPILLMLGLTMASPATVSLLNNFEIVVTAVIASVVFKEAAGKRLWIAIVLITMASVLLSVEDLSTFSFSIGALFALLACVCWGFENNCTRMISLKDPMQIVILKGFGSGAGALLVAALTGGLVFDPLYILWALVLGFFAYGLSIYFYILAQRDLGAARTSAYYAIAPFIGVLLSFVIFGQPLTMAFVMALILMLAGTYFAAFERHGHTHVHERMEHEHRHSHDDGHHMHAHSPQVTGSHSHAHVHEGMEHAHVHTPDLHHLHQH